MQNLLAVVDVCPEVTHEVGALLAGARAISEETALVRWSDGSLRNVKGDRVSLRAPEAGRGL